MVFGPKVFDKRKQMDIQKKPIYILADKLSGLVYAVTTSIGWLVEFRTNADLKETTVHRLEVPLDEYNQVLLSDPALNVDILTAEVMEAKEAVRHDTEPGGFPMVELTSLTKHEQTLLSAVGPGPMTHRKLIEETTLNLEDPRIEVDENELEIPVAPKM